MKTALVLTVSILLVLLFQTNESFSEKATPKKTLSDILDNQIFRALPEVEKKKELKKFLLGQPESCICSDRTRIASRNGIISFAIQCRCGKINCAVFVEYKDSGIINNPVCFLEK